MTDCGEIAIAVINVVIEVKVHAKDVEAHLAAGPSHLLPHGKVTEIRYDRIVPVVDAQFVPAL